ncbi:Uncharacterised protein [Burkholderia pseudomallei]|nr:hypothetical protein BH02_59 [Burkholderia pseudomallei]KGW66018.1 hypothetical protein Y039_1357 [Burkholderia pseudomallei MSHR1029]OMS93298.1 hypothetical protein AQ747_19715 [Burkholderia pseudomallei]CAJ2750454.1 Uncharacterised protein [Burkholderia pseudomallei]CAJ2950882.1 Uncharacterised protein [Burkholderia pseudomallei]
MCCICRLLTGQFILKLGQFRMLRVVPVMNCSYVVHLSNAARELPPLEVKFFRQIRLPPLRLLNCRYQPGRISKSSTRFHSGPEASQFLSDPCN